MKKFSEQGFTLVEALLIIIAISLVIGVGYFIYHTNNDETQKSANTTSAEKVEKTKTTALAKKYLEIPELGVKFELNDKLKNAYYAKVDGYYYVSVHDIDNITGLDGCKAGKGTGGFYALVDGKVGGPNGTFVGGNWTQEELEKTGWGKVGDTYYGFMHGNVLCYDQDASNASQLQPIVSDFMQAFIAQQKTFQKI